MSTIILYKKLEIYKKLCLMRPSLNKGGGQPMPCQTPCFTE